MTTKQRVLFCGLLPVVLLFLSTSALGQTQEQKDENLRQTTELKRKAYVLVDEIANGAHGLKLPENRSHVLASAADLLWPHDEKRARALFWDSLSSINLMTMPAGNGRSSKQSSKKDQSLYFAIFALRQGLLRTVARHDPQLALDMLRSTRQLPVEQINVNFKLPDDSDLEQQIATEAAARDPEQALKLARESLAKGLTFQLLELLQRLNSRDQEVGTKFAGEIIDKLQTRNLAGDIFGSGIAIDLVGWSRPPTVASSDKETPVPGWKRLKLDTEKRRQLVEMIVNAALAASANSTLLNSVSEIMKEIQEFVPERVALLQRKISAFKQTLNKEQRSWNDYNAVVRTGSPEDMIAASLKSDDEQRAMLRREAIVVAIYRKRADALREFIKNEIKDDSVQRAMMDDLDSEQITAATVRGDADELRTLLPRVRRNEERARAMAEIAVVLEKNGDHDEAVKLLDEARTLIKVDFESETQTNALLALVAAYAVVDPPKAFAIIERTIDRANAQISKALLLDKIVKTGVVKNGEIQLQNSSSISPDLMLFRYGKAVTAMANADFNRTKAAADRFDRTELRLWARLLLARALLAKDERRTR